jgi:hypothetical protein
MGLRVLTGGHGRGAGNRQKGSVSISVKSIFLEFRNKHRYTFLFFLKQQLFADIFSQYPHFKIFAENTTPVRFWHFFNIVREYQLFPR